MSRHWCWIIMIVSAIFGDCLQAQDAIVIEAVSARIHSSGLKKLAAPGNQLKVGDRVVAAETGKAVLLLQNGRMKTVSKGASYTIVAAGKSVDGKLAARVFGTIAEVFEAAKKPVVKAAVRGASDLYVNFPRNSVVDPADLVFRWAGGGRTSELKVSIKSPSKKFHYSFKIEAGSRSCKMPEGSPPFEAGVRYYWKVVEVDPLDGSANESDLCWFEILSDSDQARIEKELSGQSHYFRSAYLMSQALYHDAVDELTTGTDDINDTVFLKVIYARMKDTEALKALQK